jgi:two-component system chemotaxis sensor kinase CheA
MQLIETIKKTIVMPAEITKFESDHVERLNHVALRLYWAHLPVFLVIAYFNDTRPLDALILTPIVLAGVTVAIKNQAGPRTTAKIVGMTAMMLGGLLVHFGQGPVQIEMHFYFFAALAMLTVYGYPMVIVAAAVTVALHHLLLWVYLPQSVFNYDAPLWVVAVHATFVVLESIVAVKIARNFFDNVVGLEKIVQARTEALDERNRDLRLVMNAVDQALITVALDGSLSPEYSAVTERWFGRPEPDMQFADLLRRHDDRTAAYFEMGLQQIQDDWMPVEVALDQMPKKLEIGDRTIEFVYSPIRLRDQLVKILVVATDVSAEVARERLEAEQRQTMRIFEQILKDKTGFFEFFEEAQQIVDAIRSREVEELAVLKRLIHTLKGNAALFNIRTVAEHCHDLETRIEEEGEWPSSEALQALLASWDALKANLETLLGDDSRPRIEIDDDEFAELLQAVLAGEERADVAARIARWKLERTDARLARAAKQAEGIAKRLNKDGIRVQVDGRGHLIEPQRWSRFWATFVHAIRNAVDHGIESAEERRGAGKDPHGQLTLRTDVRDGEFVVELADDGRGVDWDTVRRRAEDHGFEVEDTADLKATLFKDGFTTKDQVSQYSGRGVGMAALREATEELGGRVLLDSRPGCGTRFEFRFPMDRMAPRPDELLAALTAPSRREAAN